MSGKTMTRREFLRGGVCALFGAAAASVFGKDLLSPETARAAESASAVDTTSLCIARDVSKCIGCGKCVEICSGRQGLDILKLAVKDGKPVSALKYAETLSESACIGCGQCARHCPSGAITAKDGLSAVNNALHNSSYKHIVWQFAPSAQHIIGEEFRVLTGADMSKKIASAVRELGPRVTVQP